MKTCLALWNLVKRARSGAKAQHGDDSDEYEPFGGTRLSERNKEGCKSIRKPGVPGKWKTRLYFYS
ncbi:MAG: hypothetical protein Fur0022_21540 [Anaerolineales bacterium]